MSKRLLSLTLALLMTLALCACGQDSEEPAAPETAAPAAETEAPAPTASPEPTPEPAAPETSSPAAETEAPAPTAAHSTAPEPTEAPAATDRPGPVLPDAGLHPAEPKPTEDPEIAARRELAKSFEGKDVEELIRELGEPLERSYAPSCLGGQDGELVYEGFTVYTHLEDGHETVLDVS